MEGLGDVAGKSFLATTREQAHEIGHEKELPIGNTIETKVTTARLSMRLKGMYRGKWRIKLEGGSKDV